MISSPFSWHSTSAEERRALPCDSLLPAATVRAHRAVTVAAPRATVFRWLCQLRAAPYSYDLLDNLGRRSPRTLTPGLDELERGQRFMGSFTLDSFERDRHLTLAADRVAVTYAVDDTIDEQGEAATRLLVRVSARVPAARVLGPVLALGDLLMMRKQLLVLKGLAERTPRPASP
ncbi:hypothetical protein ACFQLX_02255 [Streptomyces polyrhachis]|uniref:Polyketide cyclase / dehydrase and lipid transport n=1 Tax=Streptomyces polyrhachis TaxID=1282885 RepID=A0ABW2G883_9ACTN